MKFIKRIETLMTTQSIALSRYALPMLIALLSMGSLQAKDTAADLGVIVVSQPSYTTCESSTNGELEAIGFNGEPPYSYLWSNGATTAEISGLGLGEYTVTISDATGDEASASGTVSLHPEGVWIMVSSTASCNGSTNGTAYASAMLGTEPYSYVWSDGQTGANATGLEEGFYMVTATDASGCENSATVYIEESADIDLFVTSTYETCLGSNDAKATVNVLNGTGPFTYLWSDGQVTDIATGLSTGTYTVTVTDALGCEAVATEEVELSPEGLWIMVTAEDASCGEEDGSIHVGVMTGVGPYSYAWSDASIGNTPDPQNLGAGTYSVTVTDSNGCDAVGEVTVESSDAITVNAFVLSNATCDEGGSANVNASGGSAPYDISWSNNETSSTIDDLDPGTYTVEVEDANGCFGTASITIEDDCVIVPCDANAGTLTPGDGGCLISSLNISASANGDAVVPAGYETLYVLTSGSGLIIQAVSATPSFDVTVAASYTIHTLVYDPNTLDLSGIEIGVTSGVDVNNLLIQGGGDICGSLDVPGASVVVENGFEVAITPEDVTLCSGTSLDLSTNANGSGFSYQWSATGGSFDNASSATPVYTMMMPGTYTISVEVTASNGCSATSTSTVTIAPELNIAITPQDEAICGGGSIDFSVTGSTGNLSYSWVATGGNFSNGSISNPTWTMMMPGTYEITVNVSDDNGCTATATTTATVNQPPSSCSATATSSYFEGVVISTLGGSDGTASASADGVAPLSYLWSNNATTADVDGLSAGTYTVTITDANGCSCTSAVTLEDPAKLGNYVWEDLNQDGLQDANEPGIADVKVTLNGTTTTGIDVMRMMFTDENGMYMFNGLLPGTYKVTFGTPTGYIPTQSDAGDDALDSDADPIMGMSPFVDLGAGEYNPTIDAGFYTCTNIGNYVWYDENHNGFQDDNEAGVEGVQVKLVRAGFDGEFCTEDDVVVEMQTTGPDGGYLFECVDPGTYIISFMNLPDGWIFTNANASETDASDSDADPATGKTDPFTVNIGDPDDLTIDAGIRPLCDQFNGGGEIITNEDPICIGDVGHEIYNVVAPDGGAGPIEYLWMYSTVGGPFTPATYTMIPNSNTLNYYPGPLFETTYFVRCSRRLDCPDYVESNIVVITVEDCPGAANLIGRVVNAEDVQLNWNMGMESDDYNFFVEKSFDGKRWFDLGTKKGTRNASGINNYDFMDEDTKEGMNYYRLKIVGLTSGIQYTNEVALTISNSILVDVYPNPFYDILTVTPAQPLEEDAIVEIFNEAGQLLYTRVFPMDSETIEVKVDGTHDFSKLVLRIRYAENGKYIAIPLLHKRSR